MNAVQCICMLLNLIFTEIFVTTFELVKSANLLFIYKNFVEVLNLIGSIIMMLLASDSFDFACRFQPLPLAHLIY